MLVYLFQHLVIGFFAEAATSTTLITPHSLLKDLHMWKMDGSVYLLPAVDQVPCIDALSQRSHYVRANEGGGGGGGGPSGGPAQGNRVDNPNWDPRFKLTTALGLKIKKMKMKVIMGKANFDKALCAPCDKNKRERCMTYHGKGLCQKDCWFAYDHKKMPDSAVTEVYKYISDGCR